MKMRSEKGTIKKLRKLENVQKCEIHFKTLPTEERPEFMNIDNIQNKTNSGTYRVEREGKYVDISLKNGSKDGP